MAEGARQLLLRLYGFSVCGRGHAIMYQSDRPAILPFSGWNRASKLSFHLKRSLEILQRLAELLLTLPKLLLALVEPLLHCA